MIKTILFDFGNVLAFFDHERALQHLLPYTDQPREQFRQLVYLNNLAARYECGQVTTEEVFSVACKAGGLRCDLAYFVDSFCDIFWDNPPMGDLVRRLKRNGYRLVLASNTNAAHYAHYREQFRDTLAHFDAIAVSHEAGAMKPDVRFYQYAQALTKCEKSECLFVDDLMDNVLAAREFGWHGVQYTRSDVLIPALRVAGVRVD